MKMFESPKLLLIEKISFYLLAYVFDNSDYEGSTFSKAVLLMVLILMLYLSFWNVRESFLNSLKLGACF